MFDCSVIPITQYFVNLPHTDSSKTAMKSRNVTNACDMWRAGRREITREMPGESTSHLWTISEYLLWVEPFQLACYVHVRWVCVCTSEDIHNKDKQCSVTTNTSIIIYIAIYIYIRVQARGYVPGGIYSNISIASVVLTWWENDYKCWKGSPCH